MSKILGISPTNEALIFLSKRISYDTYRGIHKTQHQRYDLVRIDNILSLLNKYSPNQSLLKIRTTDLSKRASLEADEVIYSSFCNEAKQKCGIGTQDAMRKNIFVDFHRMGFIERYNKKKEPTDPYAISRIEYVSLTDLGLKLINSNIINKSFILSIAINKLLKNLIDIFLNILRDEECNFQYITLSEFMFFVSAIDYDNQFEFGITIDEAKSLIRDYRTLTAIQKKQLDTQLKQDLNPSNYKGNKKAWRDFGNWRNEAMDIFTKLQPTVYFEFRKQSDALYLKTDKNGVFDDESRRLNRSQNEITKYFKEHKVNKKDGFQLHHIVPLSWAQSKEHFVTLDKFENLIYIDGYKHGIITVNKNKFVNLKFDENNIILSDASDDNLELKDKENVIYSHNLKDVMLNYNNMLIREYK